MTWIGLSVLALVAGGCSALVDADPDAVPVFDAGSGLADGGADGAGGDGGGGGDDGGATCAGGCDDGVDCTVDECISGVCRNLPDDDRCGEGERCHATRGCIAADRCATDADCDDGLVCNGAERCDPGAAGADERTGCVPGRPPSCGAPEGSCLRGLCDEAAGGCTTRRDPAVCDDGSPCTVASCGPDDMCVSEAVDADGDGYAAAQVGGEVCPAGDDCDDTDPSVHPGASDACNGVDDDCDGEVDEDCPTPDSCEDAEVVSVSVGGSTTVYGTFRGLRSRARSACSDRGWPEAIYRVEVSGASAAQRVDIELDTVGSGADGLIAVSGDHRCSPSFLWGCDNDRIPRVDRDAKVWVHNWPATQPLWVMVERARRGADDLRLNVAVHPAAADRCGAPPIDITGGGTLVGYVGESGPTLPPVPVGGRYQGDCGGGMATEALATFQARYDRQEMQAWSIDFGPILYVRERRCDDPDREVGCDTWSWTSGGVRTSSLETDVERNRRGYLFVDGASPGDWFIASYTPGGLP